jgi:antitoxin component YwqK of YwqJK toxin-antitoxin module
MHGYLLVTQTGDSVVITDNGKYYRGFTLDNHRIRDPKYIQYHSNGTVAKIDSLSDIWGWRHDKYWGMYEVSTVYSKQFYVDGTPKEFIYYFKKDGDDSLRKKWYPNGVLQESILYYESYNKRLVKRWNDEGILTYIKTSLVEKEFYPTGAIKSSIVDTTINKAWHRTIKTYYPEGTLKTVKYYKEGFGYGTWLYYNEKGTLENTVDQSFPSEFIHVPTPSIQEPHTCGGYYTYYLLAPRFPGGDGQLYKYLNTNLAGALCKNKRRLKGNYEIQLMVDFDGTAIFQDLIGENNAYIREAVKQAIEQMPQWAPGKRNEKTTRVGLSLMFSLKKIDV